MGGLAIRGLTAAAAAAARAIATAIESAGAKTIPRPLPIPAPAPMPKTIPVPKSDTTSRTTDRTCKSTTDRDCKDEKKHSGRIQGQENNITYVPAAASGSAWNDWPTPPNLGTCTGFATSCRAALKGLQGVKDRGKEFQAGADVAYANLVKWMKKSSPAGVSAKLLKSFYFDGTVGKNNAADRDKKGPDSRRMDIDVIKGEALKG